MRYVLTDEHRRAFGFAEAVSQPDGTFSIQKDGAVIRDRLGIEEAHQTADVYNLLACRRR